MGLCTARLHPSGPWPPQAHQKRKRSPVATMRVYHDVGQLRPVRGLDHARDGPLRLHAGLLRIRGLAPDGLVFELALRRGARPLVRYRSGDIEIAEAELGG